MSLLRSVVCDHFRRDLAASRAQTLRNTLVRLRRAIIAYFPTALTNGRPEGFNNKAKLVKKRAYG